MQDLPGSPKLQSIARKWHDLAERRLNYYTELYRSGRWSHYFTEDRFAVRMLEVIEAAKRWRDLAGRPLSGKLEGARPHDDNMRPAA
jgi:uncharacterized repeat protein (TIGR03809 family)